MTQFTCEKVAPPPLGTSNDMPSLASKASARGGNSWHQRQVQRRELERFTKATVEKAVSAAWYAKTEASSETPQSEIASDPLLSSAVRAVHEAAPALLACEERKLFGSFGILASAHALHNDNERNPASLSFRLRYTGIPYRADTPMPKLAVRIVLEASGFKPPTSTEHEWAIVVTALSLDSVPETRSAVEEYLTEAITIDGVKVKGLARARARVKLSKKGSLQADKVEQKAEAERAFSATIQARGNQPFARIDPHEEVEVPEGYYLVLCRETTVVGVIRASGATLVRAVNKLGLR